jgi:mono/diheme cytochrome c family protein
MLAGLDRVLSWIMVLAAVVALLALTVGPEVIGADIDAPATPAAEPTQPASGQELFADTCGSCHTLAAAGTSGSIGPNLDDLRPGAGTVAATVENGSGSMPAFGDELSAEQIEAIAQFVAG